MKSLLTAGYVCGALALFLLPPAFGIAALVIGIMVLAKGRVGHGIALIVLSVTCGLAGMYAGATGFVNLLAVLQTTAPSQSEQSSAASPAKHLIAQDWHVVSIESRVTESNEVYSQYAWKLTIRNDSSAPAAFRGTIEFQDADGFVVADDVISSDDTQVAGASEGVFTGYRDIKNESAANITRTIAKISKER